VLSISLKDILSLLKKTDSEGYSWGILWFDAIVNDLFPFDLSAFEKEINIENGVKRCSFQELLELSKSIGQGINILVVGDPSKYNVKKYEDDELMKEKCKIVLELVDSSYWEVSTDSPYRFDELTSLP
jgi:hypothetical protein